MKTMRIVFMGTPESAVPSLRQLLDDGHEIVAVWTRPDKPAGRGKQLHQLPVKEFALQHGLTIHQPSKIKTEEAKHLFASHHADVVVVVAYGRILPSNFLREPRSGCINVHFSLLPKYRGAAPVNWAIINGESETGVTTIQIVEELDAGPILLQRSTQIRESETAPELMSRLAEMGADLLSETLAKLDTIKPQPQDDQASTFAPMLKREDSIIDWSMDAFSIERRVRGFQPWPNAFTTFDSRRLIIWKAVPERVEQAGAVGQIVAAAGDKFVVACGNVTGLRVLELQLAGHRRMTALDFINGMRVKVGSILG